MATGQSRNVPWRRHRAVPARFQRRCLASFAWEEESRLVGESIKVSLSQQQLMLLNAGLLEVAVV